MATTQNRKNSKVEQSDAYAALVGYIRGVNAPRGRREDGHITGAEPRGRRVEPIGLTEAQEKIFKRANSEAYGHYSEDLERPRR